MSTESLISFSSSASPSKTEHHKDLLQVNFKMKYKHENAFGSAGSWSPTTSCSSVSNLSRMSAQSLTPRPIGEKHQPFEIRRASFPELWSDDDGEVEIEYDDVTSVTSNVSGEVDVDRELVEIVLKNRERCLGGQRYQSIDTANTSPNHERKCQSEPDLLSPSYEAKPNASVPLYPNTDAHVWLRSCEQEIVVPIVGMQSGQIPMWIKGSLLRNGPGNLKVGDMEFKHLFDSSALLHRFGIRDGVVTYQCRFVQTNTYKKNMAANRIVVTEFGTTSVPDPCHTIFQRIAAMFQPGEMSDNAMISIYPFGDEYFAFTEYPIIHSIDIDTLSTQRNLNMADYTGIVSHTSHPHVVADGTVFNLGMTVTKNGPHYNIIRFPIGPTDTMFENARIVATIPSRWKLYPGYMHTFGMTDHYFLIVEQPLSISVPELIRGQIQSKPLAGNFKWFADQPTCIYVVSRESGELVRTFEADAFFFLHIINAYETRAPTGEEHVILDICCYKDPAMLDCMYIEAMKNMQHNPDYARMFRGRPMRFVLPMRSLDGRKPPPALMLRSFSITNLLTRFGANGKRPMLRRSESENQSIQYRSFDFGEPAVREKPAENLVTLKGTTALAFHRKESTNVFCTPEVLCDLGCETPRIYYEEHMGKAYRYFYAISSDVDAENPGTLIKVDLHTKTRKTWCEKNCYPSEPIFVASPCCESEDDGVVLAAMVWGDFDENRVGLLVLCAKTWTELGRSEFVTPGPVPKCLHGWFAQDKYH